MDIVLVYIGKLPNYSKYCFEQIRKFNKNINIHLLSNNYNNNINYLKENNIIFHNIQNYQNDKINHFLKNWKYPENNFWTTTATRFFYLEKFMEKNNIFDLYHFENDILIYHNIMDYHNFFIKNINNIAITPGGPDKNMTGFMFIKNNYSLSKLNDFFIYILSKYGYEGIKNKYKMDMVNEMTLMKLYDNQTNEIINLPIMPIGKYSKNFDYFKSIYDPATWGQFIGGTKNKGPGVKPNDHYIGSWMKKNKNWEIKWEINENLKMPYLVLNNKKIKINNLHIHSKNLKKYIS